MLLFSAFDCAKCNRAVKRDKANLMLHGRSPYIQIDRLTSNVYFAVILMRRCQESKPWPYRKFMGMVNQCNQDIHIKQARQPCNKGLLLHAYDWSTRRSQPSRHHGWARLQNQGHKTANLDRSRITQALLCRWLHSAKQTGFARRCCPLQKRLDP